jgi:predicted DNA-binding WGR domain protein
MRRFELSEGKSNKFWEISLEGSAFTVRYGKIGSAGTTQTKSWPSAAKARAEHDKLVAEKLKKGYVESGAEKDPESGGVDHRVRLDDCAVAAIFHPDDLGHVKIDDAWCGSDRIFPEVTAGSICGIGLDPASTYELRVTTDALEADEIDAFGGQSEGRLHVRHGRVYIGDPQEYNNETGRTALKARSKARWIPVRNGLYRVRIVATDREDAPSGASKKLPDYVFQLETVASLDAVAVRPSRGFRELVPRLQPSPRAEEEAKRRPSVPKTGAELAAELAESDLQPKETLLEKILASRAPEALEALAALFRITAAPRSLDFLLGYAARAATALGPKEAYERLAPHCKDRPHLRQAAAALGPDADPRWVSVFERALESDEAQERDLGREALARMGHSPAAVPSDADSMKEVLAEGWAEHDAVPHDQALDAAGILERVADAIPGIASPRRILPVAGLIVHLAGEHLARWADGLALLDRLAALPGLEEGSKEAQALLRARAALLVASGDRAAAEECMARAHRPELPAPSTRVRVLAVAASALAGVCPVATWPEREGRVAEALVLFEEAVALAAYGPDGRDPAARALAVLGNDLACALELASHRALSLSPEETGEWARTVLFSGRPIPDDWVPLASAGTKALGEAGPSISLGDAVRGYLDACSRLHACVKPRPEGAFETETPETRTLEIHTKPILRKLEARLGARTALSAITADQVVEFVRRLGGEREAKERQVCPIASLFAWAARGGERDTVAERLLELAAATARRYREVVGDRELGGLELEHAEYRPGPYELRSLG